MRCKNCGWDNPNGVTTCEKCNSPLDFGYEERNSYSPTPNYGPRDLRKTVMETDVFGSNSMEGQNNEVSTLTCPECGYPLRQNVTICPQCNRPIVRNFENPGHYRQTVIEQPAAPTIQAPSSQPAYAPQQSVAKHAPQSIKGTVNPYLESVQEEPSFTLVPIARANEKKVPEANQFEGAAVTLTRENTEKDNPTITSSEQAEITFEHEKWYIQDKSTQKTTFVCAKNKIELEDGDIILLGTRLFEFHKQ